MANVKEQEMKKKENKFVNKIEGAVTSTYTRAKCACVHDTLIIKIERKNLLELNLIVTQESGRRRQRKCEQKRFFIDWLGQKDSGRCDR